MILALLIFKIVSIFWAIYIATKRKAEWIIMAYLESLLIEKARLFIFGYLLPNLRQ
jgi:hypothetical protein